MALIKIVEISFNVLTSTTLFLFLLVCLYVCLFFCISLFYSRHLPTDLYLLRTTFSYTPELDIAIDKTVCLQCEHDMCFFGNPTNCYATHSLMYVPGFLLSE